MDQPSLIKDHLRFWKNLGLMGLALAGSLAFLIVRYFLTAQEYYFFLMWNLLLAIVPLVLAYFTYLAFGREPLGKTKKIFIILLSILWLIFYPNSSYIFTDFIHLIQRGLPGSGPNSRGLGNMLMWFDMIVKSSFAFSGHIAGLISLFIMHSLWARIWSPLWGWIMVVLVSIISAYGVFLGRFIRLNSWYLFTQPEDSVKEVFFNVLADDAILFSFSFALFIFISYLVVYAFGRQMSHFRHHPELGAQGENHETH